MPVPDRYLWAQSGVEEVSEGVFRIPLPMPDDGLRAVNVYAVIGPDAMSLIDSGWAIPASRAALTRSLARLHKSARDVREFLITHLHPDHYAQASALRAETGARISLGAEEKPSLDTLLRVIAGGVGSGTFKTELHRAGAGELLDRLPRPRRLGAEAINEWQPPDEWLHGDELLEVQDRRLRVVPTPGHTRGHVVFHDEQNRLLFSGDHILPQITPSLGIEASPPPWPLRDYLSSLRLIKKRPDAMLLPAHGPVWDSAHRRVDELIAHHEDRLNEIAKAVQQGAVSGWDVAQRLTWTHRRAPLSELDLPNLAADFLALTREGAQFTCDLVHRASDATQRSLRLDRVLVARLDPFDPRGDGCAPAIEFAVPLLGERRQL